MKLVKPFIGAFVVVIVALLLATTVFADGGSLWLTSGHDRNNTRNQPTEHKIKPSNVANLAPLWVLNTGGDVSATPAVDGDYAYFPDWAGNFYKVDRRSGAVIWQSQVSAYTGHNGDFSRTTPAIYNDLLIFGTENSLLSQTAKIVAVNRDTGIVVWVTEADSFIGSSVVQSPVVFDGRVFVGVSSNEDLLAAVIPAYDCCQFRGSFLSIDANTGQILWKTTTAPEGYSGNGVWGSSPVIDPKRGSVYITTGNNYSLPDDVLDCIDGTSDPSQQKACMSNDNLFDAIMALDLISGQIKWVTFTEPFDAWNYDCLFSANSNCPNPVGPDYDFGQGPILFRAGKGKAKVDLLGAGQKSGKFWTLNPDNGQIRWVTQVSPGSINGGMVWGSAYDGTYIYTSSANGGKWSALNPLTGAVVWQTTVTGAADAGGAVSVANGVVFGCAQDADGHMVALNAHTGAILWSYASGGPCSSGAAIVHGTVYWGSGSAANGGVGVNKLYAFALNK